MSLKLRSIIFLLLVLPSAFFGQQTTMVYLESAEQLDFDEALHPDAQVLRGDVRFRHDDAVMYCDSAYFYESTNSLDAFGHVRFIQGDTLFGYGDVLYYDGNARFARLRRNVKLQDPTTTLTTDSLNYDRNLDKAWYYTGGKIEDDENTMTSTWGQYISGQKQALFKGGVHLVNDDFVMDCDTLKYNTETKIADILGETTIVYEEETTIYTTKGWYNTESEESMLLRRSLILHDDGSSMTGDTIYYDKKKGFGRALNRIEFVDPDDHITLYGNYGEMWEHGEKGDNSGYATDSALMVDWSDSTLFSYIHADTLYTEEISWQHLERLIERDSILIDSVMTWQAPDSVWKDTTYRRIRARHGVRIYREDMQAICDSSIYNTRDSVMNLFGTPVMWNKQQQVSAEHIDVYLKDDAVDYVHGIEKALIIQQKHPIYYNQIAGKEMLAYVEDEELRRLEIEGNVEAGVFPQEDDGTFVAYNVVQSAQARIFFKDGELDKAVFLSKPTGTAFPLKDLPEVQTHLEGFFWAEAERPLFPDDVFRKPERTPRNGTITTPDKVLADEAASKDKTGREKDRESRKRKNRHNR